MLTETESPRRALLIQDEYGRIRLSPDIFVLAIASYAPFLGVAAIFAWLGVDVFHSEAVVCIAGATAIRSLGRWAGASPAHRAALAVFIVLALFAPIAAHAVVPEAKRSGWWPSVPVELGASLIVLAGFAATTQLRSFAPPYGMLGPGDPGITVSRQWTAAERRNLLAPSEERVFRSRARWYLTGVSWALAVVFVAAAVGFTSDQKWTVVAVAIAAAAVAVWCGVRGPGVALIVNSEMVTVRNIWRTYRVSWSRITGIVPADSVSGLRLRLGNGVFVISRWTGQPRNIRFKDDPRLQPLLDLLGPEAR